MTEEGSEPRWLGKAPLLQAGPYPLGTCLCWQPCLTSPGLPSEASPACHSRRASSACPKGQENCPCPAWKAAPFLLQTFPMRNPSSLWHLFPRGSSPFLSYTGLLLSSQGCLTWRFHVCSALRDSGPCKSSRKVKPGTEMPSPQSQEQPQEPAAQLVPLCSPDGPNLSLLIAPSLHCPRGHSISAHPTAFPLWPFPPICLCRSPPSGIQHSCRTSGGCGKPFPALWGEGTRHEVSKSPTCQVGSACR